MTRDFIDYRSDPIARGILDDDARPDAETAPSYSTEQPTAGFYRFKMRSGGHPVGVRIWFGPPLDPIDGSELDRGHRWQATVNNRLTDLDRVWPACGREPIDHSEHDHLASVQAWGEQHAPKSPQANPNRPIDLLTAPLLI